MTDEQTKSFKLNVILLWMKSLCASMTFWLSSHLARMLCHMIRDDEMKLCDQNMLECDDKVSLATCDEYNQSNISEWQRQKVKNNHQNKTWQFSESHWSFTFWRQIDR